MAEMNDHPGELRLAWQPASSPPETNAPVLLWASENPLRLRQRLFMGRMRGSGASRHFVMFLYGTPLDGEHQVAAEFWAPIP